MDILKFLKSFNTVDTYLILAILILVSEIIYFYYINPI